MTAKLLLSSIIVSAMTFLSRILGLVRDVIIAVFFGAEGSTDAFLVAQKIPNFLRRLFAEGAFAQAFIPVLTEYKTKYSIVQVKLLVDKVAGTLGLILLLISAVAVFGSNAVMAAFSPGFYLAEDPSKYELAAQLLKITFPYLFFIALTAFCGSILNTYDRFAVPAITPIFLNISIIIGAFFGQWYFEQSAYGLAWGVFIAGIIQLGFQLPFLWRLNLLPRPRIGFTDPGVKKIFALMLPGIFGVSVSQINLLLDTQIASFLQTGSITWLYMSDRLLEFPLGVFGIAIATVILPALSLRHAEQSSQAYRACMDWGLRLVLLIGMPAALGLIVLAEPLTLTLFQYKNFTLESAYQSSLSLVAYAFGLLPFMLIKVLAPGYFSRQDTKTPVKIGVIAMVVNMVFNLLLFKPYGHVGLAIATTLSALVNASLLYQGLRREAVYLPQAGWFQWWLKLIVANCLMVLVIYWLNPAIEVWRGSDLFGRGLNLLLLILAAMTTYVGSLFIFGVRKRHLLAKK